tara:strand:+ start:31672 stop:32679 length:1008 start_codon:yes stop_codon:yes gene_type:complete
MKTYIIAEVGPNHNGSVDLAIEYIQKLSEIGVDAIKFQLAIPEKLYSKSAFFVEYQKKNVTLKNPLEMGKKYQFSFETHKLLYEKCKENNITYLCSAFDLESIKFLNTNFDLPYFKIGSGEIFSVDIINYISKINKPILLSTGFATFDEIEVSLNLFNKNFEKDITILHCISRYPTPMKSVNLSVMLKLKEKFKYPVGFSDHTMGNECAIAAVAMGAKVIEKHVTLDNKLPGPDHKASITIKEFSNLVKSIRNVEIAIGNSDKKISDNERKVSQFARKSIVTNKMIKIGQVITVDMLCFKRPGSGFLPIELDKVIGKRAKRDIEKDTVIKRIDLD